MTNKPKLKNAPPTPRRYWWIFGTLALVLLIGLRFPLRLKASYELNLIFYCLIGVACILALIRFVRHFHWRRGIVIAMLSCVLLAGWNIKEMQGIVYWPLFDAPCTTQHLGMVSIHDCYSQGGCLSAWASYISIMDSPLVVQTSHGWNGLCILF